MFQNPCGGKAFSEYRRYSSRVSKKTPVQQQSFGHARAISAKQNAVGVFQKEPPRGVRLPPQLSDPGGNVHVQIRIRFEPCSHACPILSAAGDMVANEVCSRMPGHDRDQLLQQFVIGGNAGAMKTPVGLASLLAAPKAGAASAPAVGAPLAGGAAQDGLK